MRRNLNFKETNQTEARADAFLKNCPPRSVTTLCAIAIEELISKYKLENATPEDVARFVKFHDFYKAQADNSPFVIVSANSNIEKTTAYIAEEKPKETSLVSSSAKDAMADVMSSIFGLESS